MERTRDLAHPIHDLLKHRWSPRAFADRPVEREKLLSVLEAARWSASSSNEQPWAFVVATREEPEEFDRLLGCLVEQNRRWARAAPVLMLSVARRAFTRHGQPNAHAWHDVGQAAAYLTVQAMALDLYAHQMAGFDAAKARQTFSIPDTADPVAAIALGYLGDPDALPDDLRQRELTSSPRKPLGEFVFSGRWGEPAAWAKA
jgi:nitroreductase